MQEKYVDSYYVIQPTGQLLGYTHTSMLLSTEIGGFIIIDNWDQRILAYINNTTIFPLGSHPWYFVNGKFTDDNETEFRMLNLHLAVGQPGYFCCANGLCIESELKLKCDEIQHCEDNSDEIDCDLVEIPKDRYDSHMPPITKETNGNINVEISITLIDIC